MSEKNTIESLVKEKQALAEAITDLDAQLAKYKELGTPEQIDEAVTMAQNIVDKVSHVNFTTLDEDLEELAKYREIGEVDKLDEVIDKATETISIYKQIGEAQEIANMLEGATSLIEQYSVLGKPKDIEAVMDKYEEEKVRSRCEEIGAKFNVDTDLVRRMYEKADDFSTVQELLELSFNRIDKKLGKKEDKKEDKKPEVKTTKKSSVHNLSSLMRSLA